MQLPPWSSSAEDFLTRCTRCGDCLSSCPTAILVAGDGGFPTVDFSRGECTFCAQCVAACGPRALRRDHELAPPWNLKAVIGHQCLAAGAVECRVCGEACLAGAIRFRPTAGTVAQPQLDASRCAGCGACYAPCPSGAIALTEQPDTQGETPQCKSQASWSM